MNEGAVAAICGSASDTAVADHGSTCARGGVLFCRQRPCDVRPIQSQSTTTAVSLFFERREPIATFARFSIFRCLLWLLCGTAVSGLRSCPCNAGFDNDEGKVLQYSPCSFLLGWMDRSPSASAYLHHFWQRVRSMQLVLLLREERCRSRGWGGVGLLRWGSDQLGRRFIFNKSSPYFVLCSAAPFLFGKNAPSARRKKHNREIRKPRGVRVQVGGARQSLWCVWAHEIGALADHSLAHTCAEIDCV